MSTSIDDPGRLLESVLGFEYESGDHVRYVLRVNGMIIARTKFSRSWRGNQQVDDSILSLQAKQLHCSNQTLKGLLRGQLGKKHYFKELLKRGIISQDDFDSLFR
jgi:hypothetical protein